MWVFVEDRAIGADVAASNVLLLADTSDTTGRETGCTRTDELGEATEDFCFGLFDGEAEIAAEEVDCVLQVLKRIPVDNFSIVDK